MSIITKALKKAEAERAGNSFKKMEDIAIRTMEPGLKTNRILQHPRKPLRWITPILYVLAVLIVAATTITFIRLDRGEEPLVEQLNIPTNSPDQNNVSGAKNPIQPQKHSSIDDYIKNGAAAAVPSLNGIMYSTTSPQAVINGEVVSEGDKVGNYFVFQIFPDKVRLTSESGAVELKLQ